jgi:hypothetical protein
MLQRVVPRSAAKAAFVMVRPMVVRPGGH